MDDSIQILKDKYKRDQEPLMMVDSYINSNELRVKPMFTKAAYVNMDQHSNAMPDVRGMSLLQAKIVLRQMGYKIKFSGSGQVAWQSPKPGTDLNEGSVCTVGLQ